MITQSLHTSRFQQSYTDVQAEVNVLLAKFGLPRTLKMLRFLSDDKELPSVLSAAQLKDFLLSQCLRIYGISEEDFLHNQTNDYRYARMACMHLLRDYGKLSHRHIGQLMGITRRSAGYFILQSETKLRQPQFHQAYIRPYEALEFQLIQFISTKIKEQCPKK